MRKCNRYSYGFDFGFQVGDKETRRNEDKGNLRVSFSSLKIVTVIIAKALIADLPSVNSASLRFGLRISEVRSRRSEVGSRIVDSRVHAKTQGRKDCPGFRIPVIGSRIFGPRT